jgi:hypothetical protein
MASQLPLAQTSWQHRLQAAHQPPRTGSEQPVEAPQLAKNGRTLDFVSVRQPREDRLSRILR